MREEKGLVERLEGGLGRGKGVATHCSIQMFATPLQNKQKGSTREQKNNCIRKSSVWVITFFLFVSFKISFHIFVTLSFSYIIIILSIFLDMMCE